MGCMHTGVAAQYFRVAETGARDVGSAHIWAKECLERIRYFEEVQAVVKLQSSVRRRQTWLKYNQHKSTHSLPGSQRLVALKIQCEWRMIIGKREFRKTRAAAITIQCHIRGLIATRIYKDAAKHAESDGYDLASNTLHCGGIGKQFEDDQELGEFFTRVFGLVLACVVRYRKPDPPDWPHNSWALLTFEKAATVEKIFELHRSSPDTALVSADEDITFIVRPVDPKKAMTSQGSFGQIFQECRRRVKRARAELRWLAAEKKLAEEFTRRRMVELAAPTHGTPQKMMALAKSRHLVVREYADGWLYCRTEGEPKKLKTTRSHFTAAPAKEQRRGTEGKDRYWFNINTAESRWSYVLTPSNRCV